jgi:hypothetical protein
MIAASTNTWRRARSSFAMSREIAWKSEPPAWMRSAFCCLSAVTFTSPLNSSAVTSPAGAAWRGVGGVPGGAPGGVYIDDGTGVGERPPGPPGPVRVAPERPCARFESVCAISSAFAFRRKTTWMPPSVLVGTSSWSISSWMRW